MNYNDQFMKPLEELFGNDTQQLQSVGEAERQQQMMDAYNFLQNYQASQPQAPGLLQMGQAGQMIPIKAPAMESTEQKMQKLQQMIGLLGMVK